MNPLLSYVASAQLVDRRAAAAKSRLARQVSRTQFEAAAVALREQLVLRRAVLQDGPALERLAELDSAVRPAGEMLVAEVDEQIVAAVPLHRGHAIADPFRPTARLVELLRLRAA